MKAIDIKTELRQLIDQETDQLILEAIRTLLKKSSLDPILKQKLSSRALQSEKNIKSGKVYDRSEAETRLKKRLGI